MHPTARLPLASSRSYEVLHACMDIHAVVEPISATIVAFIYFRPWYLKNSLGRLKKDNGGSSNCFIRLFNLSTVMLSKKHASNFEKKENEETCRWVDVVTEKNVYKFFKNNTITSGSP
jgi:hypothetical protein